MILWRGKVVVDEKEITRKQYEAFFDWGDVVLRFDIINQYLADDHMSISCTELVEEARDAIRKAITDGHVFGRVQKDGQTLGWAWEPISTAEWKEITTDDLSKEALDSIAEQMLEKGKNCGVLK